MNVKVHLLHKVNHSRLAEVAVSPNKEFVSEIEIVTYLIES